MAYLGQEPQWPAPPGPGPQWPAPAEPVSTGTADKAYRWFVVYAAVMVVVYLLCIIGGIFLLLYDFSGTPTDVDELRFQGIVLILVGLGTCALHSVGLFLPKKPWGWIYGLVLIGLGLTSCCTWPVTIPLIIQWLKPEMKARFGTR